MVAVLKIHPISPPVDEVEVQALFSLPVSDYDKIMGKAVEGTRRSPQSSAVVHMLGKFSCEGGTNTLHLDIRRGRGRSGQGHRDMSVSLAQEWFPPGSTGRGSHNPEDVDRILGVLDTAQEVGVSGQLTCNITYVFEPGKAEPFISLPFPMSLPQELSFTTVSGIELSNTDETQTAELRKALDGHLFVRISLKLTAPLAKDIMTHVLQEAQGILEGLVNWNKEGNEQ